MQPIGVFDSGVGGLSVLQALRRELPDARFIYLADAGHAPYGERDVRHVLQRSLVIGDYLVRHHGVRALVVACNTATAAAIAALRASYPGLPIVGVEPALKPAAAHSQTGVVGVLATRGTLESQKFQTLLQAQGTQVRYVLQACDGLAAAIEHDDAAQTQALCARYTAALGRHGAAPGAVDTVVLGCTHYTFAADLLRRLLGPEVALIDAGQAVAQRTRNVLCPTPAAGTTLAVSEASTEWAELWTTGVVHTLQDATLRWLTGIGPARHVALA